VIAIAFLTLAGIVNYLDRSTLSIANHSVSQELGLSASQMGLLLSAFSFAYAFSQLPIGMLLDRFGARVMLGLGMFVWSAAQLCGGFVTSLQQFLIARVALGLGEAPNFPAGAKVVSEWFGVHERGRPIGIFITSSTIGPALAPPILTALLLIFGWRTMFIIMGALGIAVSIGWYLVYRDRRAVSLDANEVAFLTEGEPGQRAERRMTLVEWRGLFRKPTTWGMIFGNMGVIYMVWLYLTWLPAYLEHERHLTIAHTGWIVSIPYLFGTLGMLSSGFVADGLMARGMAPMTSRKWPICVGLIGCGTVHRASRVHAQPDARDGVSVRRHVLRQHGKRCLLGTGYGCRAAPPGGVAWKHPELRRVFRRLFRAIPDGDRGGQDAFIRRCLPAQRGRRVRGCAGLYLRCTQ
jgi:sugar phosphate permease